MSIRSRLTLWYFVMLLIGVLFILGRVYYEMVVDHPRLTSALAQEGYTPFHELAEILVFGGFPALLLALVGGWFLMRRALSPVSRLTRAVEGIRADTMREEILRSHNGDELDRLTEVFNSMMARLDNSFTRIREFTLHASHELKTPLTIMRGEIETRLRDPATPSLDHEFLANQLDEITRLANIVDSLAFLAKADAGQLRFEREPVRLDELVRESFSDAQILAEPRGLNVELQVCESTSVMGDRYRLRQVLLNLTDNAIKYNHPGGRVTLHLGRRNGDAELLIANTGPGIPPEKLARVFDRFYRGDSAHSSSTEGSGLGLSIAEGIVRAHGGFITMTSQPPDLTVATVRIPIQ